ncbi:ubiquitin carboxyl-terminal hydrolase 10 isoform X1 [Halyomorpha halys]|uniref:ubiquitin carboxyl-terminal hydrolase 10 isoform X1 n=2 Tax=Halyomorpha halys TaxID=286706 RepID=UPI0006D4DF97|nr:ubiquitin carboxyl-terminal hydrolase 10 isoform X1 [Halyomorpha halys]
MEQTIQLQFLDLDDIDLNEIDHVKSLLYSVRSPRLTLPWVEPEEVQQWNQQQYDGEPEISGIEASGVAAGSEVYQVPVAVATTMHQMYHQVVPPLPNLPPAAYVGNMPPNMGYPIQPQYIYPEERTRRSRSNKPSPKRSERRDAPSYPPTGVPFSPAYPIHVTMPPAPYSYIPQAPHIPSAQHATGPPLHYLPPPAATIPVYPAHPIYPSYTTLFSPHVHHDDYNKEPLPQEEKNDCEEEEKPIEKPLSVPINAIKTTAPPTTSVKKQQTRPPSNPAATAPVVAVSTSSPAPPTPTPPPPATTVDEKIPEPGKSWAGLFKEDPPREATVQRKPPISAVAVSVPPRLDPNLKPTQPVAPVVRQHQNSEEDPLLRSLGERLSSYQLEHKAIVLTPRGLTNPSNYCYINATLQALLACPAFYNLIKVISQVKDAAGGPPPGGLPPKSKTPIIDSMVQFIKEFSPAPVNRSGRREKAIWKDKEDLDISVGPAFEPTYVYKMLHALRNETAFQVEGRQEDAEEFLSLLLNGLNDEMLELVKLVEEPKEVPVVNGDVTANGESHDDNSDWKEVSKGVKNGRITRRAEMGKTPLTDIFRGQLRSRLQRADETTDNVQPFFTLQLDIESSDSVPQALEKYFGWDQVEGAGSSGGSGGEAWQQHYLEELPNVLILHLKCFHYKQQSCHKIVKALEFPVDLKIDPKLVSNKNKSSVKMRQYKLFAVVYHDGKEASKGHYLADTFHVGSSGWIRYDDAVVKTVTEGIMLKPRPPRVPYLLYYRRADTIGQHTQIPR